MNNDSNNDQQDYKWAIIGSIWEKEGVHGPFMTMTLNEDVPAGLTLMIVRIPDVYYETHKGDKQPSYWVKINTRPEENNKPQDNQDARGYRPRQQPQQQTQPQEQPQQQAPQRQPRGGFGGRTQGNNSGQPRMRRGRS